MTGSAGRSSRNISMPRTSDNGPSARAVAARLAPKRVIYRSSNLIRTAPDLGASTRDSERIRKAHRIAEEVREQFRLQQASQENVPSVNGSGVSADARRHQRRVKMNRDSAAISRVRREAYVSALELQLVELEREFKSLQSEMEVMHSSSHDTLDTTPAPQHQQNHSYNRVEHTTRYPLPTSSTEPLDALQSNPSDLTAMEPRNLAPSAFPTHESPVLFAEGPTSAASLPYANTAPQLSSLPHGAFATQLPYHPHDVAGSQLPAHPHEVVPAQQPSLPYDVAAEQLRPHSHDVIPVQLPSHSHDDADLLHLESHSFSLSSSATPLLSEPDLGSAYGIGNPHATQVPFHALASSTETVLPDLIPELAQIEPAFFVKLLQGSNAPDMEYDGVEAVNELLAIYNSLPE